MLSLVHGGAFKFPAYGERIQQILSGNSETKPNIIMTKDFGNAESNACLDGVAIATVLVTP